MRRRSLVVAAAGLIAVGLGGAPAFADTTVPGAPASAAAPAANPVFTLSGEDTVAVHPYPAGGKPKAASFDVTLENPSQDEENGAFDGDVTVTFDLRGLAGVADIAFDSEGSVSDCSVTGATAVCTHHGLWPGLSTAARVDVTAAKDSKLGATGSMKVTAKADGATFTSFSTKVTVGGPDLVMNKLPLKQKIKPGQVQGGKLSFANTGTTDADGVLLTLKASHGLEFAQKYGNCEYTDVSDQHFGDSTDVQCHFSGTYKAGTVYELDEPLGIRATDHAYIESFIYRIEEDPKATFHSAGPLLTATPKKISTQSSDLDPWDNQQEFDFQAVNKADFRAYGDAVTGKAGETVKAKVGFRNKGPAWIAYLRSGENVAVVDFTVPAGAEVTKKPASCEPKTIDGEYREKQLGAPRYVCPTSHIVREDADLALPFELKINKVVKDAKGAVTVRNTHQQEPKLPFDPTASNNTAQLILNGTPKPAPSASATPSPTPTATGGSSTSGGNSNTTTDGGGSLASTGSSSLLPMGAAAAALAAGGALYVVARRRRA
ncbi:LPXTG cell wall anchor domain-containing protein [Streptomyces sp. NBC_01465]|uniref:LPXTG cell wall anchor domain-containing protein n=1 Tax=Streptomyces sp. NBC_01465 TaxID=2903878 RepID=UPI002E31E545|nr:LPXTG cell wall anchor domain-containing protein [Streptomyces sp. NBC_01465]